VHETIRVKSAAWDENGVLVYTTLNHIKYCLPNGDSGIIRTLDVPVYITKVFGNVIFCLDRDGKNRQIQVSFSTLGWISTLDRKWFWFPLTPLLLRKFKKI
jgi:coatomer subunit alpha